MTDKLLHERVNLLERQIAYLLCSQRIGLPSQLPPPPGFRGIYPAEAWKADWRVFCWEGEGI